MAAEDADGTARLRIIASYVILGMFVVSWAVSLVDRSYSPPGYVSGAMVVLSGWLYGSGVLRRDRDRTGDGEP